MKLKVDEILKQKSWEYNFKNRKNTQTLRSYSRPYGGSKDYRFEVHGKL